MTGRKKTEKLCKKEVRCNLCEKTLDNYNTLFNHLYIDEEHAFDICPDCIKKIMSWQSKKYALLFPTKAVKKRYGRCE